ncbi:hypothetical protein ACTRW9_07910 [Nitrospina sp. 32_T5]
MGNYLVVGGTGVMGQAAIEAVRETQGKDARIIANWFGKEDTGIQIEGADETVFGDITDPQCRQKLKELGGGRYEYLFYATALGAVGFAIRETTPEQIKESNRVSFDPMVALEQEMDIGTVVSYSTFYTTRHQLGSYGAMGYSKEALEKWTFEPGKSKRACIRAGLFESSSSRGIKLLLRKTAKDLSKLRDPLIRGYFEGVSTKDGVDNYLNGIMQEEKELFGDSPTRPENLKAAHLELFKASPPVFVNVCGAKIWLTHEPLLLQKHM